MKKLIVYDNFHEILICNPSDEKDLLKTWFNKRSGRNLEEYDRKEYKGTVEITTRVMAHQG